MQKYKTIEEYAQNLPKENRDLFDSLRTHINKLIPKGEEVICYGIPTVRLSGKNLVHYAIQKKHVGLYPGSSGITAFENEFIQKGLKYSKGAVQFPMSAKIPFPLITKIIQFLLVENKKKINS